MLHDLDQVDHLLVDLGMGFPPIHGDVDEFDALGAFVLDQLFAYESLWRPRSRPL